MFNYWVLWQVKSRIDIAKEVACELTTSFKLGIIEQIEEVLNKVAEKSIDQSVSDPRLQLIKELSILNLLEIIIVRLLCVFFDTIV